jgi:nucleoporin NDC1
LAELKLLIERLNVGLDPAHTPVAAPGAQQPAAPVNLVPQISNPLKDDRMIVAPPANPVTKWEQFEATTSSIAKAHSSSANVQQAYGREAINMGKKKAQEGAQQADSLASLVSTKTLSSPIGWVFSRSLPRTARMVVLGAPYSRISLICNAVTALTNLTMFSISQDALGRFHQGVPDMVRVFTLAINKMDEYMSRVEIHWSDKDTLSKPEDERRKVPEIEQVRECLQDGLEKILASFADYLVGMGMSRLEIMEAKKAAKSAKKPEMVQAGAGR